MALAKESGDDTKTDDVKVSEFKNDICDITGTATTKNQGNCRVDENNKITITQSALIDYMSKKK
jgi:hypothetical protein